MTLATIMVSVDFDPTSKSRISLASELAKRFKSLLIGVAGWPLLKRTHNELEVPEAGSVELVAKELEKLGEQFRTIAGEFTGRVEWRCSMDFPREIIPKEARAADLVVIGQGMLRGLLTPTIPEQLFCRLGGPFWWPHRRSIALLFHAP